MPERNDPLPHLLVHGYVQDQAFTRAGRGDFKIRDVERRAHGQRMQAGAQRAFAEQDERRVVFDVAELESLGVVITIEGATGFPLKLESLEQRSTHRAGPRPKWLLLNVQPATDDTPERAQVWISDEYRANFLELFEKFVTEDHATSGKPKNRALVANMARIRATVLRDLWQSEGEPPTTGRQWWEVWLQPNSDAVEIAHRFASARQLSILEKSLRFDNRHVVWIQARWDELHALPSSAVLVTSVRLGAAPA